MWPSLCLYWAALPQRDRAEHGEAALAAVGDCGLDVRAGSDAIDHLGLPDFSNEETGQVVTHAAHAGLPEVRTGRARPCPSPCSFRGSSCLTHLL